MRLTTALFIGLAALLVALAWHANVHHLIFWWVVQQQQALQGLLANEIAARKAGDPTAFWSLIALCAAYGFLHAAGPGHGKALVAGGAVASGATAKRMALIATAGSLAQSVMAIALVLGGLTLFAATAREVVSTGEGALTTLATAAVTLIGVWICIRGIRALPIGGKVAMAHGGHHSCCGHAHHPDPEEVDRAQGLRDALVLVAGMAIRPCTGAVMVLVVAWRMGVGAAGAAGVLAMGMGTAAFTCLVALLSVRGRDAALFAIGESSAARYGFPALQILAGAAIIIASLALFQTQLQIS
ncbi:MAG: hypothetical protein AAGG56_07800 [Pseudomonadota bacterium]